MPQKYPDITPAQIVAVVGAIVTQLVTNQFVSGHTARLITGLAGILVPVAWMIADAVIRHGRSRALTPVVHVQTTTPPTPGA